MWVPVPDARFLFGEGDHESESRGPGASGTKRPRLCAKVAGFSLHAGRTVDASDRDGLELGGTELLARLAGRRFPRARVRATACRVRSPLRVCVKCGGKRKVLAFLTDPQVVKKILSHLGLETAPLPLAPARVGERERRLWPWDESESEAEAE